MTARECKFELLQDIYNKSVMLNKYGNFLWVKYCKFGKHYLGILSEIKVLLYEKIICKF